jgi:BirA family transcriptional regulator, biotin operon repressor / biotin---[acetyl-CoA-carboxylase] ligase
VGAVTKTFRAFDPLTIQASMAADTRALLRQLTVLDTVDSTNLFLQRLPLAKQQGHAVVADSQESGRGRRGRCWHSPAGGNIYLSVGWKLPATADSIARLPLAVAVCIARAIQQAGIATAGIKWPNDILVDGKKLAGVLLEARHRGPGGVIVLIGVGINVRMPPDSPKGNLIEQAWIDVCSHLPQPLAEDFRDRLCGAVLGELLRGLELFAAQGFAAFAADWNRLDILYGRAIDVTIGGNPATETVSGTAAGISTRGGLLVHCPGPCGRETSREFLAGDVSVRLS